MGVIAKRHGKQDLQMRANCVKPILMLKCFDGKTQQERIEFVSQISRCQSVLRCHRLIRNSITLPGLTNLDVWAGPIGIERKHIAFSIPTLL